MARTASYEHVRWLLLLHTLALQLPACSQCGTVFNWEQTPQTTYRIGAVQALRTNWALKSRNRNYSVSVRSKFNSIGDFYFPLFHRPFSECYLLLSFAINLSVEQSAERQLHTQTMKGYLFWNDVLVMFGEFLMKLNLANDSIKVIIEWIISEQWALWFFGTQSLHVISLNFECSKSTQSNKLRWCCTEKILASCRFVSACNITASTE